MDQAGKCGAWINRKKIVVRTPASSTPPNTNATTGSKITRSVKTGRRTRNQSPRKTAAANSGCSVLSRRIALSLLGVDSLEDLFPVHGDILRRIHTDTNLVAFYAQYSDCDFGTDHEGFVGAAGQDQHRPSNNH